MGGTCYVLMLFTPGKLICCCIEDMHAVNLHALPFKNSIIELTGKWLCTFVHSTGKFDPSSSDIRISNLNCADIVSKATGRVGRYT